MAAVQRVTRGDAEHISKGQALMINIAAAKGLQEVLRTNLGPKGTLKMLVGGAGQIKLTKDGNTLLHEMQIQHPTAVLIARAATATDDTVGDGTTSSVLFIGELLKQAERFLSEGLHPRVIVDGFDIAKEKLFEFLESYKQTFPTISDDRELLCSVCRTALQTKLRFELAEKLTEIVTDALLTIRREGEAIDLHMVEVLHTLPDGHVDAANQGPRHGPRRQASRHAHQDAKLLHHDPQRLPRVRKVRGDGWILLQKRRG